MNVPRYLKKRIMNEKIGILTSNLTSATKQLKYLERDAGKLRIAGNSLYDEISTIKTELEYLTKQLEESTSLIANARHQLAMIDICTASERNKVSSHIDHINVHKQGFYELFNRERELTKMRERELREKEAEELELERQKRNMAAARNEQRARSAAALGAEADALEQACAVLKKRNNAIMLKLRRKLVETEDRRRRELLKIKDEMAND